MPTATQVQTQDPGSAGVSRSEPGGRAQRNASGREVDRPPGVGDLPRDVRELLSDDVVDELLAGARGEEEIVGPGGLLSQLTKRLVERAMEVELTDHLGYEPHLEPRSKTPSRNGHEPAPGQRRCSRSRFTSETDYPTNPSTPPTQKVGRPLRAAAGGCSPGTGCVRGSWGGPVWVYLAVWGADQCGGAFGGA
jgi:hypothetical protein